MTTEAEILRTIPISQDSLPDLEKMVKLTKTYDNGNVTVLYAAGRATRYTIDSVTPKFFKNPHGQRESVSFHRSGLIMSCTDVHCSNAPVRRRSAFLLVWGENDKCWMTWHIGSVSSIAQGERLIDKILESGILPE